jgi:tRNA-dihydrouridine synthase A
MSHKALLYTEMVTAPALVRGDARHLLRFDAFEHPVAVQLGGSDPMELARATRMCVEEGYAEVNFNVGCPSDRVQSGFFGAVLMERPGLVADCVAAMRAVAGDVPVTVKCRIGVDDQDPSEVLPEFLARIVAAGCERVTIHARKAWLQGLSPKENRDIPPLDYDLVREMKILFPHLHISINGGIASLEEALSFIDGGLDGAMIGRAAYHDPYAILAEADQRVFGVDSPVISRHDIALAMIPHIEAHLAEGGKLGQVTRHMLGLFTGQPGARAWRRTLSEGAAQTGAGVEVLQAALAHVMPETVA